MHFFCVLFSCINKAIGLESCESFQEETVSDDEGQYRLRGLQVSSVKMIELFFLIVCRRNSTKHPPSHSSLFQKGSPSVYLTID